MLLFSTILDINNKMTEEKFIRLIVEWNDTNPRPMNSIPNVKWKGERNVRYGDDSLWMEIVEYKKERIIAVRHQKKEEDGSVWDTDYVMNFNTYQLGIRLDRSFTEDALNTDEGFSTPHFITLLIEKGYLKDDGDLPVLRVPTYINESNAEWLSKVIKGEVSYDLPIIYVSKTKENQDPVDVGLLGSKTKGVAHVFVQEDVSSNSLIRSLCDSKNEYNGAIGIYIPNGKYRRYFYYANEGFDDKQMKRTVHLVVQESTSKLMGALYTYQGVQNALLLESLEKQKEVVKKATEEKKKAEEQTNTLLESLDEEREEIRKEEQERAEERKEKEVEGFYGEIDDLNERVLELTQENEALRMENQYLNGRLENREEKPLLYFGQEEDYFPGEIKDFILSTLIGVVKNLPDQTRRKDVLQDILNHNEYESLMEQKEKEMKNVLNDYRTLDSKVRQLLTDLGFTITDDGKHYKIIYKDDNRYQVSFSKTSSDVRAGKNLVNQIKKTIL